MKIVLVHRAEFQKRPPLVSLMMILIDLGFHPILITTGINNQYAELLDNAKIEYHIIPFGLSKKWIANLANSLIWGDKVRKRINIIKRLNNNNILLWIEGNYTFASLGSRFIIRHHYVLQHQELFKNKIVKNVISRIINNAIVNILPEYNRAQLYRMFFNLEKLPVILPNKPYFVPDQIQLNSLKEVYKELYESLLGKKIILFQGVISQERDLSNYIKSLSYLSSDYRFVILGKDHGMIEKYKRINKDIIYIPHIDAPDYLLITSLAYIGIITYSNDKLNTLYCAPNKVFEYSSFGVPILGNDIPGLKYVVEYNSMGVVCDESVENIVSSINIIEKNYQSYSINGKKFYKSTNNPKVLSNVIANIERKIKVEIE